MSKLINFLIPQTHFPVVGYQSSASKHKN